jgi:hypothetical protein
MIYGLTKLDVARRQLNTAIELWFADRDAVSIHALAYSSHEIIHTLCKKRGVGDLMFDSSSVKDEYRSEFAKLVKEDGNFFKHARSDLDATRDFHPDRNIVFLTVAATGMSRLVGEVTDLEAAFMFWLYLQYPDWFPRNVVAEESIPADRLARIQSLSKKEHLEEFLAVLAEKRQRGVNLDGTSDH